MKRILMVEDNEMNRDALSRRLVRRGFDVALATNGFDGIAMAQALHPDIILLDLGMAGLDGWECARRLKSDRSTSSIPIVALTAHAMAGSREQALEAGCDEFDTKPIEFDRLLGKIDQLLAVGA
jgi:two-component system, cell cycle response regulator DivK